MNLTRDARCAPPLAWRRIILVGALCAAAGRFARASADDFVLFFNVLARPEDRRPPMLELDADGRAGTVLREPFGGSLDPDALASLIAFIVGEMDFFSIDTAEITAEIAAITAGGGRIWSLRDGAKTVIRVRYGGRDKTVSFYGLRPAAAVFPEVEPLRRLAMIEQRLHDVIASLGP